MKGHSRLLMTQFRLLGLHVDADPAYKTGGTGAFDLQFSADFKLLEQGRMALFLRVSADPHESSTLPFTKLVAVGMGTFPLVGPETREGDVAHDVQVDAAEAVYGAMRATIVSATAAMPGGPHRLNAIDWDNVDINVHPTGAVLPDLQAYTG